MEPIICDDDSKQYKSLKKFDQNFPLKKKDVSFCASFCFDWTCVCRCVFVYTNNNMWSTWCCANFLRHDEHYEFANIKHVGCELFCNVTGPCHLTCGRSWNIISSSSRLSLYLDLDWQ